MHTRRFIPFLLALFATLSAAAEECSVASHTWPTGDGSPTPPSATALADVDGDGIRDVVIAFAGVLDGVLEGVPCDPDRPLAGIYSGRTRDLLRTFGSRSACDPVAVATANAGDLDGDGLEDVAVSTFARTRRGRLETFSSATGQSLFSLSSLSTTDMFGASICSVGDLDGDGKPELAVGAPFHDDENGKPVGAVHVLRGVGGDALTGSRLRLIEGSVENERFGSTLVLAGDFSGTGTSVLLVGATSGDESVNGSAHFFALSNYEEILTVEGDESGELFGYSVAGGEDVDGDGLSDAIVGAPGSSNGDRIGRALIVYGREAGSPGMVEQLDGRQSGDRFGAAVVLLGDLDGDDRSEIAVGAPGAHGTAFKDNVGVVVVLASDDRSRLAAIRGSGAANRVGAALFSAGDVDGFGGADLLVSSRVEGGSVGLYLLADTNRDGLRDTCDPCITSTELESGVPVAFALDSLASLRCFHFDADPESVVKVSAWSSDEENVLSMRLRWGEAPTLTEFDQQIVRRSGDETFLLVPHARADIAHVVVNLAQTSGQADEVQILFEALDGPTVESIFPPRGALDSERQGSADTIIKGAGFDDEVVFWLEERDVDKGIPHRIDTLATTRVSSELAEATFDLSGAPRGLYNLHAENPDGEVGVLERAFAVVSAELRGLYVGLTGTDYYRRADQSQLTLRYANVGDVEIQMPFFQVRDNVGTTRIRLESDGTSFRTGSIQVLGVPGADGGRHLPPGAVREIPILYRSVDAANTIRFFVSVFRPDKGDSIDWRELQNPDPEAVSDATWRRDLSALSVGFGRTWQEYRNALGGIANRLARRRHSGSSVRQLLRFATTQARRLPSAAIVGEVRLAPALVPLASVDIAAFSGDEMVARTTTSPDGSFALEGVTAGSSFRLIVDGFVILTEGLTGVKVPKATQSAFADDSLDVIGLDIRVAPGGPRLPDVFPPPDENALPNRPPELPDALFTRVAAWSVELVGSRDPNAKEDDVETGDHDEPEDANDEEVNSRPVIHYTIFFENSRCATASAAKVTLVDRLDGDVFDLSTLHVAAVSLGGDDDEKFIGIDTDLWRNRRVVTVAKDVRSLSLNPQLRDFPEECAELGPDDSLPECDGSEDDEPDDGESEGAGAGLVEEIVTDVNIVISLNGQAPNYELIIEMTSCLDPDDNCAPFDGFLAPNDCETHRGEGFVTFSIRPSVTLGRDENVDNEVAITFDDDFSRTITKTTSTDLTPDEPPGPATFPSPTDNPTLDESLLVAIDRELSWQSSLGATTCHLSVWKLDPEGVRTPEPVIDATVTTAFYTPVSSWEPSTSYEWEIVPANDLGKAEASTWTFRTNDPPPPPPANDVELIGPSGPVEAFDLVTLSWTPSSTADDVPEYYSVKIWEEGLTTPEVVAHVGASTEYESFDLEEGHAYSWQIVVANESGEAEGPVWQFSTTTPFVRGDVNGDGGVDISDPIETLNWLFLGGETPTCRSAGDFDDNAVVEITDAIATLQFLFNAGAPPPEPRGACGPDPTPDDLACEAYAGC